MLSAFEIENIAAAAVEEYRRMNGGVFGVKRDIIERMVSELGGDHDDVISVLRIILLAADDPDGHPMPQRSLN